MECATATAEQIVLAMEKMSYITGDVAADEVVLMESLNAMRTLLLSQVGCLLTNSGACDRIQAIIKISDDNGFGVLLKEMAERTWGEVVQVMFARLPQFSEDVEDPQLKQLRIKSTIDLCTQCRRRTHTKHKQTKSREADYMPFSIGEARENPKSPLDSVGNGEDVVSEGNLVSKISTLRKIVILRKYEFPAIILCFAKI